MYKESDFSLKSDQFSFRKDSYPLSKINDVRVKRLRLLDNIGQIIFWVFVFSGAVWLAIPDFETAPFWLKVLVLTLTAMGFVFSLFRCSKYALQIEFKHIDETGVQWITVAKSYSKVDETLFKKQAITLKKKFV